MKRLMLFGLILVLGFVLMIGCNPSQPTQPQTGGEQGAPPAKTDAPPPPPGSPATAEKPPAPPDNELPYLFTKVIVSADKNAKDEALAEETDMIFDENVGVIAVRIEKNKDIPTDKEFDFVITQNGKPIEQFAVKASEVTEKDKIQRIKADKDKYTPGPYELQITEKGSNKKIILHFAVGAPPKPGDPGMEPGKAPGKPGEPGMEPGKAPGKPGEPGMEPGKAPGKPGEHDVDMDKDEPGDGGKDVDEDTGKEPTKKEGK